MLFWERQHEKSARVGGQIDFNGTHNDKNRKFWSILDLPGGGGHTSRDVALFKDYIHLYIYTNHKTIIKIIINIYNLY